MINPSAIPYSDLIGTPSPFMDLLGVKTYIGDDGRRRTVLALERCHLNGVLNAHGGIILTLLDVAMAAASRMADERGRSCVTVEMKVSFLRPGGALDDIIEATGVVTHATGSLAFCDGELRNAHSDLLATASGTFKYLAKDAAANDG